KARVKEADAIATEKLGLVEARVSLEKMQSHAAGEEKQGLAKAKVKEADAGAVAKLGVAEASALREKLNAEAAGEEAKGLASATRGDDEAVFGMVEKLLVNDPAALARLKSARNKPAGAGE